MKSSNSPIVPGSGTAPPEDATTWAPEELGVFASRVAHAPLPVDPEAVEEAAREAAYAEGYEQGLAQGSSGEQERLNTAIQALESASAQLQAAQPQLVREAERSLCALAVSIARQIIQRELTTGPDTVRQTVARALGHFPMEEGVTLRMNPQDLSTLSAAQVGDSGGEGARELVSAGRVVRWRPDPSLGRGDCIVEGPERLVDGRVDQALMRIYHEIADDA